MAVFTVTLIGDAVPYEVYGGLPAAQHYLLAAVGDGATAWKALSADDQGRWLVAATRYIDAQIWQGTPTGLAGGTATTLQFPRTGLTNLDGSTLDATNVPQVLINACFEMAAVLADDATVQAAVDAGSNLKSMGAGSARLEFFQPQSSQIGNVTTLPTPVDRLVGRWLAAASGAVAAAFAGVATGTNSCSNFGTCSTCGCSPCCCEGRVNVIWPL